MACSPSIEPPRLFDAFIARPQNPWFSSAKLEEFAVIAAYRLHRALYDTLVATGLILLGFYLTFHFEWLHRLVEQDRSYLSVVMLGLYGLMTAHWFRRMTHLSELESALIQSESPLDALSKRSSSIQASASNSTIEAYADQQFNQHAIGHFISEVLLKLGLMGTVLGFILMLVPIADLKTFEPQALQILLSSMSGGMAVALYTTLTGLITSTLMKFQYYLADSAVIRINDLLQGAND